MTLPPLFSPLRLLAVLLLLFLALPAAAQTSPLAKYQSQLAQAEADLRSVDHALDTRIESDQRTLLRAKAVAAQQTARASESQLEQQLALVDARVSGLGPAPTGATEAPEIQRQRRALAREHSAVDSAIKRGRLADVEAQQLIDEIDRAQAERLNEALSQKVASPLSPAFWGELLSAFPRDMRRVELFLSQGGEQSHARSRGGFPWQAIAGLILGAALLFPVRIAARRAAQRYLIGSAPGHRIRRSGYAMCQVIVGTLFPALGAFMLVQGARWAELFPKGWDELLDGFVAATGFAAFTSSLAGAVLMRSRPSWRIAPISDATAQRLRPATWVLAGLAFASILLDAFNRAVGVSLAAITAAQATEAMLHLLCIAAALLLLAKGRASLTDADSETPPQGAGLAAVTLLAWVMVVLALLALVAGYIGLSLFVARLIVWLALLSSALYLLLGLADDAATTLFSRESRLGITLVRSVGLRASVVDQFGILVSGALRVTLVLTALGMLMTPFGGGGGIGSVFGRLGAVAQGVEIGGVAISPGAILRAVIVLAVGLTLVRAFMGWLERRYLPATDLDGSARNSAGLVARYVGVALAIIWALASLGIGVERIALLLSALSVGIGFGLQAITQNFVSGLILLAERPIKIGDWVRVGTDEGDVKRISVRSTEIALGDHSTLIVPNSELITKAVLNKTLSGPLGRIQVQFSVPLETDAEQAIAILLETYAAVPGVLAEPAPSAFIDSLVDGRIVFNSFAHVASPRDVYKTRSQVFRALLKRLAQEGIDIGTAPQRLELAPGETLPPPTTTARMPNDKD